MMTSGMMQLSLVVPAWNESRNLPSCIETLAQTFASLEHEIIIVNDGSRDETLQIAQEIARQHPDTVRLLSHEVNKGLGAALRTGFGVAQGAYVTCCPADFQMTAEDWQPFGSALGKADVLVGCRVQRANYNVLMRFNAWLYPRLVRSFFGLRLRDVNWICVYRTELVRQVKIEQNGIPMLTEILVKLRDLGATFLEVDCRMQPRQFGKPSAARFKVMRRTLMGLLRLWWGYRRPAVVKG